MITRESTGFVLVQHTNTDTDERRVRWSRVARLYYTSFSIILIEHDGVGSGLLLSHPYQLDATLGRKSAVWISEGWRILC